MQNSDVKVPISGMDDVGRPSSGKQNAMRADVLTVVQHITKSLPPNISKYPCGKF